MTQQKDQNNLLSDRIRKKLKEAQESANEEYLSLLPAEDVQPVDPDTDKKHFSKTRKNYESHLDVVNHQTLTGDEFNEKDDLNKALIVLNQAAESLAGDSNSTGISCFRKLIRKVVMFGLGAEMETTRVLLSEVTRSINLINHKTRIFAGKQQGFNTETAEFGQTIVPVIDEKIRYQLEKTSGYLKDRMDCFHESMDRRQTEIANWLHNTASSLQEFVHRLDEQEAEMKRGLALQHKKLEKTLSAVSDISNTGSDIHSQSNSTYAPAGGDYAYYLFETQGRGSEEFVSNIQSDLVDLFKHVPGQVLDIGCGRGEFLSLLRNEKIEARGIDANLDMVAICKEKGLNVEQGDAIREMKRMDENSVGGLFAGQVVEHLSSEDLNKWLQLANYILVPGGLLVYETINTASPYALTSYFYKDPTHKQPRHPDTYRFLTEIAGFEQVTVTFRSPVDLPEISTFTKLSDELEKTQSGESLLKLNSAMKKLTDYVFAPCDILVQAKKPGNLS
ncbi:class I SAM-dependent methyltransferase [bacterium]|nr:class I SAM-dependent methyltransferase [bacterium]